MVPSAVVAMESGIDWSNHQAAEEASPCVDNIGGKDPPLAVEQTAVSCTGAVAGTRPFRFARNLSRGFTILDLVI